VNSSTVHAGSREGISEDLLPLTMDRLREVFDHRGWARATDADGVLEATFNSHPFWVVVSGTEHTILQVRGRWNHPDLPVDPSDLLTLCNVVNCERIWPKAYVRTDEGTVKAYGEVSYDYRHGASDLQLDSALHSAVVSILHFFEFLEDRAETLEETAGDDALPVAGAAKG
jgi:hypothetical protein